MHPFDVPPPGSPSVPRERGGVHRHLTSIVLVAALSGCTDRQLPLAPEPGAGLQAGQSGIGIQGHYCRITPEAARRAAQRQGVISLSEECSFEDLCPTCDGLFVFAWDDYNCYLNPFTWDPDNDGMHNGCENALAAKFAPELILATDCNWDYGLGRMGGEYYFAAERKFIGPHFVARIAYLPAYYRDCGAPLPFPWCDPIEPWYCLGHTGDSEFIIVDVRYEPSSSHWVTEAVFLSAHCGTSAARNCTWWSRDLFAWVDGKRYGAPVVWVADGKHAHYYSAGRCDNGGWGGSEILGGPDTCNFNNRIHRFPVVYTQQNIGSRLTTLADCVTPAWYWGSSIPQPQAIECMWNTTQVSRFDGWLGFSSGEPAALYGNLLSRYAEF